MGPRLPPPNTGIYIAASSKSRGDDTLSEALPLGNLRLVAHREKTTVMHEKEIVASKSCPGSTGIRTPPDIWARNLCATIIFTMSKKGRHTGTCGGGLELP